MKLSKDLLWKALFHAYRESADDSELYWNAMGELEIGLLEIEGYIREAPTKKVNDGKEAQPGQTLS